MIKLLFRKVVSTFLFLFAADLIDRQEETCIGFLLSYPGILAQESPLQYEMWLMVRQYAMFQGLSDLAAFTQLCHRAGLSPAEVVEARFSLHKAKLLTLNLDR